MTREKTLGNQEFGASDGQSVEFLFIISTGLFPKSNQYFFHFFNWIHYADVF